MKKIGLLVVFVGFFLASVSNADPVVATQFDPACIEDFNDPFALGLKFTTGPNAGKCLDTRLGRSISLLTQTQRNLYGIPEPSDGSLSFANFTHDGKQWVATLRPEDVEEVIFQIEYFPAIVPAAHTQIRFKFKAGREVQLIDQVSKQNPIRTRVHDLVYSVEAVRASDGEEFDVFHGLA